jgi:hypothetical protein
LRDQVDFIPLEEEDLQVGDEHLDFMTKKVHSPQPSPDLDDHLQSITPEGEPDPFLTFQGIDTNDPGGILSDHDYILVFDHSIPRRIFNKEFKPSRPNLDKLRPHLGWAPNKIVEKTLENTTQYARYVRENDVLKKHFKSRYPALNVRRRNEDLATDTVFADTRAVDNGATCAQLFVGRTSLLADSYGMKTDGEFARVSKRVSEKGEPQTSSLVIELWLRSPTRSLISSEHIALMIGKVNPITNIKTMLSSAIKPSRSMSTRLWTVLAVQLIYGYSAWNTHATY